MPHQWGDLIYYPGNIGTLMVEPAKVKLHWNITASCPVIRYVCMETKGFYPTTPIQMYKYVLILVHMIPKSFIYKHNLQWVYDLTQAVKYLLLDDQSLETMCVYP